MQLIYPQFHPFNVSSSPSGSSQSVFGQQNNSSSSPFAPKPFGSPTPFGSITVNSTSGSTTTGVSGAAQTTSRFSFGGSSIPAYGASSTPAFGSSMPAYGASSTPAFGSSMPAYGASSTPAFGSSMPAYGASSTPAFGSSMPAFGASSTPVLGSSFFGQVPAFGGFGSTPTQISPFGCSVQPSQPAFGSSIFGLTGPLAFGATGTPAPGATSVPSICATSTPVFFVTSTPVYFLTSTPVFFATNTPAFGSTSTPAFDCTRSAFGMSSAPVFKGEGPFWDSSNPVFGSSSTPAFEASSSPAFGASAFGQSSSAFGTSSPFRRTTSTVGGSQTPAPVFGNTGIEQLRFRGQRGGSRVASYSATVEAYSGQTGKLESISAMPVYKDKIHEELRWEDYQLGDKGAPPSTGMPDFNSSTTQRNVFGQSSANPFPCTSPNYIPFAPKTFGTSASAFSSPPFPSSSFPSSTSSAAAPSTFGTPTPAPFGDNSSSQAFRSSTSLFNTASQGTSSPFGTSSFRNTQPSQLFSSAAPTNAQSAFAFGPNTAPFRQTAALSQSSLFSLPPSGLVGNIYSSGASLSSNDPTGFGQTAPSVSTPFQFAQPAQSSGTFSFSNFAQTQPAGASSSDGTPGMFGQNNVGLQAIPQSSMVAQAAPITDPFGTLPALPQMSIGQVGTTPSVQYGISDMHSGFGGQRGGSRIAIYSATAEADSGAYGQTEKLASISAMPVYKDKVLGQKPALGGFGSTPTQTSPFGSATQPSQPSFGSSIQQLQQEFGSSIFSSGSTPFGASSQPAFGSTGPAFGATSTPASGATITPAFGAPNPSF